VDGVERVSDEIADGISVRAVAARPVTLIRRLVLGPGTATVSCNDHVSRDVPLAMGVAPVNND